MEVSLVTPAPIVSAWTVNTLEALPIAKRVASLGIEVIPYTAVGSFRAGAARLINVLTGTETERPAGALVAVTARLPVEDLHEQLRHRWSGTGIASVTRIGDCLAPSTIQQAVYTGHKWARELDEAQEELVPRELPMIVSARLDAMS
jgi:dimethylamine/trimethylamine dehydrogenase